MSNLAHQVASIHRNYAQKLLADKYNLTINSVTWEDTSRTKFSSGGSNISDLTLATASENGNTKQIMPIIRRANYQDLSCDLKADVLKVTVGNETLHGSNQHDSSSASLRRISFKEYVQNISNYLPGTTNEQIVPTKNGLGLWIDERDKEILTSVQYCILPLDESKVEFNVQLYNYQSYEENPAVLVIVATSQGTSAQVVSASTGSLYFNVHGQAANFLAQSLKDDRLARGKEDTGRKMDVEEQERNVLFMYQIPLKQKPRPQRKQNQYVLCSAMPGGQFQGGYSDVEVQGANNFEMMNECYFESSSLDDEDESSSVQCSASTKLKRGIDHAMLSVGNTHSEFQHIGKCKIERDERFPIRLTLQYYQVTDEPSIPESVYAEINDKINSIYKTGVAQGSLVTEVDTGRATETNCANSTCSVSMDVDVTMEQRQQAPLMQFL